MVPVIRSNQIFVFIIPCGIIIIICKIYYHKQPFTHFKSSVKIQFNYCFISISTRWDPYNLCLYYDLNSVCVCVAITRIILELAIIFQFLKYNNVLCVLVTVLFR